MTSIAERLTSAAYKRKWPEVVGLFNEIVTNRARRNRKSDLKNLHSALRPLCLSSSEWKPREQDSARPSLERVLRQEEGIVGDNASLRNALATYLNITTGSVPKDIQMMFLAVKASLPAYQRVVLASLTPKNTTAQDQLLENIETTPEDAEKGVSYYKPGDIRVIRNPALSGQDFFRLTSVTRNTSREVALINSPELQGYVYFIGAGFDAFPTLPQALLQNEIIDRATLQLHGHIAAAHPDPSDEDWLTMASKWRNRHFLYSLLSRDWQFREFMVDFESRKRRRVIGKPMNYDEMAALAKELMVAPRPFLTY